jgi:hypothetical protein
MWRSTQSNERILRNVGSSTSCDADRKEEIMTVTRRSFLVGAGSIITASLVADLTDYLGGSRKPFIATPREHSKTIFYEQVEDHWRLHLGEPKFEIPEPQLLIENLRWHGYALDTQKQIDDYCEETGWTEEQLFAPMDGWDWETQWEHNLNPEAQAFEFLSKHDIFPGGSKGQRTGEVVFEEFSNPMSCWRWVEVHDPLSLSLLQARLNELKLGVEVREYEG